MRKSTDWNWGLNDKSREARRVWPDLGVYAIVSPGAAAGTWYWRIYPQIPGHGPVRGGTARSSDAAKRGASEMVRDLIAPARRNPASSRDSGWVVVDAAGRQERLAWPDRCIEAIVRPSFSSRHNWDWDVRGFGYGPARGGHARSRSEAKRAAVEMMDELVASARRNPSLGMPGMPHTWVTKDGVHVSGGDTIEYWTGRADLGQGRKVRAKVNRMLVFADHVMVDRGWSGDYVDDANFVRVVKKASRKNPSGARRSSVSKEWRWA